MKFIDATQTSAAVVSRPETHNCFQLSTVALLALPLLLGSAASASVSAVSVSPNSGGGSIGTPQTFTATYSDTAGAPDLQVVYLDIGGAGAPHSCFIAYVQASNALYLFNDTNSGILGPITPGTASAQSNTQCTLSGSGGVVGSSGNNLTVPLNLTFMHGFTGARGVNGFAQSYSGAQSGWTTLGSWTPGPLQPLGAVSMAPSSGSGLGPNTFQVLYTDPQGASDIQVVYLDFGIGSIIPDLPLSCIVAFVPYNNTIYLINDLNTGSTGPINAGGSGAPLSNTQCSVSPGGVSVPANNDLTVPFKITFTQSFVGISNVWGLAQNFNGTQSGWKLIGSWTPNVP